MVMSMADLMKKSLPQSPSPASLSGESAQATPAEPIVEIPAPVGLRLKLASKPAVASSRIASAVSQPDESEPNGDVQPSGQSGLLSIAGMGADSAATNDKAIGSLAQIANIDDRPANHVSPTAPERALVGELTESQSAFLKSLESLYLVFDDAELFMGSVSRIMTDLIADKSLAEMILPADANVILRGSRASAGMAQVKKTESRAKVATRKSGLSKIDPDRVSNIKALAAFGGFDD